MKYRLLPVLFFLVFAISCPLFGQTAARLEALLETPSLTWEQAADFILEAADTGLTGQQALTSLIKLPKNVTPGDSARLNGVALLVMRSFNLRGGIFYSIARSPHHAYRELVHKKIIRGSADPGMPVSGSDLLQIINRVLAMTEGVK